MTSEQINIIDLLSDQKKFKRLVWIIVIIMASVLLALCILLFYQHKTNANLKIDFTKTGATVVINNNNPIAAQFLLPASSRWTNTGIELKPNSKIDITASGKINLAIHRLIESAFNDTRPPLDWCSPKGLSFKVPRKKDIERENFLIRPDAQMGVIIGYFLKQGDPEPSFQNPRPEKTFIITETTIKDVPAEPSTLWLIINDVLLDPRRLEESKLAYYGPYSELTRKEKLEKDKKWNYIITNDYWDLWFDDNSGYYLIQIKEDTEK